LACIDGPIFDAHKVNFDDLLNRVQLFKKQEAIATEQYNNKMMVK
jgi:ferredoxin--NADP+ reductase